MARKKQGEYPEIVQQIHREFHGASDYLLNEAHAVLKKAEAADGNKAKMLEANGFVQTPEVIRYRELEGAARVSKETASRIDYYRMHYPNNKFITEQMVIAICEKYGLMCGDVTMYKGFVPAEKLKVIDAFRAKKEDMPLPQMRVTKVWEHQNSKNKDAAAFRKKYGEWISVNDPRISSTQGLLNKNVKLVDPKTSQLFWIEEFEKREYENLQICAPAKDMNTEGATTKGVFAFFTKTVVAPDPVVMCPVNGGFLIIAAWGDEASDPIVVNEVHN